MDEFINSNGIDLILLKTSLSTLNIEKLLEMQSFINEKHEEYSKLRDYNSSLNEFTSKDIMLIEAKKLIDAELIKRKMLLLGSRKHFKNISAKHL